MKCLFQEKKYIQIRIFICIKCGWGDKYLHLRSRLDRFHISTFKMYIIVRFQYELEWVGCNPSVSELMSLDVSYNEQL